MEALLELQMNSQCSPPSSSYRISENEAQFLILTSPQKVELDPRTWVPVVCFPLWGIRCLTERYREIGQPKWWCIVRLIITVDKWSWTDRAPQRSPIESIQHYLLKILKKGVCIHRCPSSNTMDNHECCKLPCTFDCPVSDRPGCSGNSVMNGATRIKWDQLYLQGTVASVTSGAWVGERMRHDIRGV